MTNNTENAVCDVTVIAKRGPEEAGLYVGSQTRHEPAKSGVAGYPEMRLTGDRNQCRGCGQPFNSTVAFERHRRGEFGHNRHCLTPDQMEAAGMCRNAGGWWVTRPMTERALRSVTAGGEGE